MIVSEVIDWLKTQDQGATVLVLKIQHGAAYEGDSYLWVPFDPEEVSEYRDMRNNPFAVGRPWSQDRDLEMGAA